MDKEDSSKLLLVLQAFTSLPLSFLRLFGLVLYWIKSKFAATPRAKARVWSEQRYEFGTEVIEICQCNLSCSGLEATPQKAS